LRKLGKTVPADAPKIVDEEASAEKSTPQNKRISKRLQK
jgi:hypothetical protein